jgi:integrase/recombinase XerD
MRDRHRPIRLDRSIRAYLDHLQAERNCSPNTIGAYRGDLARFAAFCSTAGANTAGDVRREMVEGWLSHGHNAGNSPGTLARKLSVVRGLFTFLVAEELVPADPTRAIEPVKVPQKLPVVLTEDEARRLLRAPDEATPLGLRNRAMLALAYACGLRVSELVGLRLVDLDLEAQRLAVLGKGRKRRTLPVAPLAVGLVRRYIATARPELDTEGDEHLFLSRLGGPLTRQMAWKLLQETAAAAGITKPIGPHTLRHSCATHMHRGGANIRSIQAFLGHASIGTTMRYLHLNVEDLSRGHRRFHPRSGGQHARGNR